MSIQGWKYYNHAMIPECPPNQDVDISAVKDGEIWRNVPPPRDTVTCTVDI